MKLLINTLTIGRAFFGLFIFLLIALFDNFHLSLILLLLGSITDYLDGYLARKYNKTSVFGEIFDPIADKIFIVFILIGLAIYFHSFYIGFITSLIISREIWVTALRDFNSRRSLESATKVIYISKVKTAVQFFAITSYFIGNIYNNNLIFIIADVLLFLCLLITLYTGYIYTINSLREK